MRLLIFLFSFTMASVTFAAPPADQILKNAEKYRTIDENYTVSVKVTNRNGNAIQDESEFKVYIKDNSTSLVEQISPVSSRGRKLLMIGNDVWMRTPDIKKAIRISLEQKLTGEIANGDLAKTNFYADYEPQLVEETKNHFKLHLKSKHEGTTYQQIYYYIALNNFVPIKAEFMAVSGKILKSMEFDKPDKKVKGRNLISKVKITDAVIKSKTSIMKYHQYKLQKIEESVFNRASL